MQLSNLKIRNSGLLPWSGGNCQQVLSPIDFGELWRTVNGGLVYISNTFADKYRSVITATDKLPPAFANLQRGEEVEIHCITELWQKFDGGTCQLKRPYVEGSLQATDTNGYPLIFSISTTGAFTSETPTGFIGYRPILRMLISELTQETNEWEFSTKWRLVSEEV